MGSYMLEILHTTEVIQTLLPTPKQSRTLHPRHKTLIFGFNEGA
jgi:hypothetical protein